MIQTSRGRIIESLDELPRLSGARELFLDVETTLGPGRERAKGAFHPYLGDRVCGVAVTADDVEDAWYAPIRHKGLSVNLPADSVLRWLSETVGTCGSWVNHNVKFDAHFLAVDNVRLPSRLIDTLNLAKIVHSDRMDYDLKTLASEWCGDAPDEAARISAYLKGIKSNDYGQVPADMLGEYACADVQKNRKLWREIQKLKPEGVDRLWETEISLTSLLLRVEQTGLLVDVSRTKAEGARSLRSLIQIADRVHELTGVELADSNACFHEILVTQLGLPVLGYTEPSEGRSPSPSFDKDVMELYAGRHEVLSDERSVEVVRLLREYRAEERFKSLYVDSFLEKIDKGARIHSSYNQTVRTGRMSCSDPNSQQLSPRARALIVPSAGRTLVCWDASQIEFRIIIHYCKDAEAITRYSEDPHTDYHQWVADMCEGTRKEAKTLNFAMAYGAGKRTTLSTLTSSEDTVLHVSKKVDEEIERGLTSRAARQGRIALLLTQRADSLYARYHEALPGIRLTAREAQRVCTARGYVRNLYGRRRHLPLKQAHRAWNSLVQGCAADLVKERAVAVEPELTRLGCEIVAIVHDEILVECPTDMVDETQRLISPMLEQVPVPLRVPIRWECGRSPLNWAEAKP